MTYFISLWLQKEMQLPHKEILMPWKKNIFLQNLCALSQIEIHIHFTSCKL